jgi:hypothetical protein
MADKCTICRPGRPLVTRHHLKCWVSYFGAVLDGSKPFEVRRDDRGFEVGDELLLREYHRVTDTYTGRELLVVVTYKFAKGPLRVGWCVLGIRRIDG